MPDTPDSNREAYGHDAERARRVAEAAERTDADRALASELAAERARAIAQQTRDGGT